MNEKHMRETIKSQRDKSRQLLTACLFKIKETDAFVEKVRHYYT